MKATGKHLMAATKLDDSSFFGSQTFQPQDEPQTLLEQLGGMVALASLAQEFCRRVSADATLQRFLDGYEVRAQKAHQKTFFAMAFTQVPDEMTIQIIKEQHMHVFEQGLNAGHFDRVLQHLVDTLRSRGFNDAIVLQAISNIAPLRTYFEDDLPPPTQNCVIGRAA